MSDHIKRQSRTLKGQQAERVVQAATREKNLTKTLRSVPVARKGPVPSRLPKHLRSD